MKMEKDFEGKTALVTGGSRGIGHAVCLDLAKGGARVAVNYTSNREAAEETVQTIIQDGGEASAFKADVSNPEEVQKMVAETEKNFRPHRSSGDQCRHRPQGKP